MTARLVRVSTLAIVTLAGLAPCAWSQNIAPEISVKSATSSVRMVQSSCDADTTGAICRRLNLREADEFRILDGTHVQYTYYSGRKLRAEMFATSVPEKMEVVVELYPLLPDHDQVTVTRTVEVRVTRTSGYHILGGFFSREDVACRAWNSDLFETCPQGMQAPGEDGAQLREPVWPKPARPRGPNHAPQAALASADRTAADKIMAFRTCEIINPDSVAATRKNYRAWLAANRQVVGRVEASEEFKTPQVGLARMRALLSQLGPERMCTQHLLGLF